MEAEVVEVDVTPAAGISIDQAYEDFFALNRAQVDGNAAHRFRFKAGGSREDRAGVFEDELDARRGAWASADQERGPPPQSALLISSGSW